jgi:hypothetical protein
MTRYMLTAVLVVAAGAALADRVDTVLSATATWTHYTIEVLPDGGSRMQLCGYAKKADGGVTDEKCAAQDLTGATRTSTLNLGDTGLGLWKSRQGL